MGAGAIGERHQLDRGDPERGELGKFLRQRRERAFGGRGADVDFVDHRLAPRPAAPVGRAPLVLVGIDDEAVGVDPLGLKARRGIGHDEVAIDPEAITRARADPAHQHAVEALPIAIGLHRLGRRIRANEIDTFGGRREQRKTHAFGHHIGAERHEVMCSHSDLTRWTVSRHVMRLLHVPARAAACWNRLKERPASG